MSFDTRLHVALHHHRDIMIEGSKVGLPHKSAERPQSLSLKMPSFSARMMRSMCMLAFTFCPETPRPLQNERVSLVRAG